MWQTEGSLDHWWSNKGFQGLKFHGTIILKLVFVFHYSIFHSNTDMQKKKEWRDLFGQVWSPAKWHLSYVLLC
jgi:hypothetical protein